MKLNPFRLADIVRSSRSAVPGHDRSYVVPYDVAALARRADISVDYLHRIEAGEVSEVPDGILRDLGTILFNDPGRLGMLLTVGVQ